jgi:hypothetical protein
MYNNARPVQTPLGWGEIDTKIAAGPLLKYYDLEEIHQ